MTPSCSILFPLCPVPSSHPSVSPRWPAQYESLLPLPNGAKGCSKTWLLGSWPCASLWWSSTQIRAALPGHVFIPTQWTQSSWCFFETGGFSIFSFIGYIFIHPFVRMPGLQRARLSYWWLQFFLVMPMNRNLGNYLTAVHVHILPQWRQEIKHEWQKSGFGDFFFRGSTWGVCVCVCLANTRHLYSHYSKHVKTITSFNYIYGSFVWMSSCLYFGVFFRWRPQGSTLWASYEGLLTILGTFHWGEASPQTGRWTWKWAWEWRSDFSLSLGLSS